LVVTDCVPLEGVHAKYEHPEIESFVDRLMAARRQGRPVLLMMGAHPIKLGLSRFVIDLVNRGIITHIATSGAGLIHDFELSTVGGTSEDVSRWIAEGRFGLWQETSQLNDIINAISDDLGLGEAVGAAIENESFPHRDVSILAAGYRNRIPVTVHVGIGCDIIHAHPNCDGAAIGRLSYNDFLIFARSVQDITGGVFLNVGTSVTGPEVFLKALSMARNVAHQQGHRIVDFTTAVVDIYPLPVDCVNRLPTKDEPAYYFRPWKTLLKRTIADGGASYYFAGDHRVVIPSLWSAVTDRVVQER
jgi:hypothetical protein